MAAYKEKSVVTRVTIYRTVKIVERAFVDVEIFKEDTPEDVLYRAFGEDLFTLRWEEVEYLDSSGGRDCFSNDSDDEVKRIISELSED